MNTETQSHSSSPTLRAWMMWLLASCFVFYKYILEFSPGVLKASIVQYFNITSAQIGFFFAVYYIAYAIMQLPIGLLVDRFGPKKVLVSSLLMCLVGAFMLGSLPASQFGLACVARFVTGIGAASAIIGCMKLIANWFPASHFAKMTGFMMTIGMVGAGLSENLIQAVLSHMHMEWTELLRQVGYVGLVLGFLYVLFIKDSANQDAKKMVNARDTKAPSFSRALKKVLSTPQSWLLSLYSGLMFAPVAAFAASWGKAYVHLMDGFSAAQSTGAVSFVMFGFALGSPFWGWLSDYVGYRKVFLWLATLLSLVSSAIVIYVPGLSFVSVSVLFLFFGFIISAFVLSFSMIKEIHSTQFAATSIGFMNAFNAILCAAIVYFIGAVIGWALKSHATSVMQATHTGMLIVLVVLIASAILLCAIKETHCQQAQD